MAGLEHAGAAGADLSGYAPHGGAHSGEQASSPIGPEALKLDAPVGIFWKPAPPKVGRGTMIKGILTTLLFLAGLILNRGGAKLKSTVEDVYGKSSAVAGLETAFQQKHIVKLLLVHGMGPHVPGETLKFTNDVAGRLGFTAKVPHDTQGVMPAPPLPPGAEPAQLWMRTYTRRNEAAPGQTDALIIYEVTWSPLIDKIKHEALKEDSEHAATRVGVNKLLKQNLMNDRLTDPVMYLGAMGPYIRNAMKHATCRMVNGIFHQEQLGAETCTNVHDDNIAVAIVTWSLGSRIVYDALMELEAAGSDVTATQFVLQRTFNIYMLANQLPLLQLSQAPVSHESGECVAPPKDSLRDLLQLAASIRREIARPITIVTISDPTDLLSYPIPKSFAEDIACKSARFVNVTTPIARPFASGYIANPMTAHTGHTRSPFVLDLLAHGHERVN
jgi:hypothetical protein